MTLDPTLNGKCTRLLRHFQHYVNALTNTIIVLLVFALKHLITDHVFDCPCSTDQDGRPTVYRISYGFRFMAIPAIALWMLRILMLKSVWRCLTGCTNQPNCAYCGRSSACLLGTLAKSALAPVSWLVFVFLDGRYLECVMADAPRHCLNNAAAKQQSYYNLYMSAAWDKVRISKEIGLALAGVAILAYFITALVVACCSNTTYYQREYGRALRVLEEESMLKALREHHEETLKAKWKMLFTSNNQGDWINIAAPEYINPDWRMLHKTVFFTPFEEHMHDVKVDINKTKSHNRPLPPIRTTPASLDVKSAYCHHYSPDPRYFIPNPLYSSTGYSAKDTLPLVPPEMRSSDQGKSKKKKKVKANQVMDSSGECEA